MGISHNIGQSGGAGIEQEGIVMLGHAVGRRYICAVRLHAAGKFDGWQGCRRGVADAVDGFHAHGTTCDIEVVLCSDVGQFGDRYLTFHPRHFVDCVVISNTHAAALFHVALVDGVAHPHPAVVNLFVAYGGHIAPAAHDVHDHGVADAVGTRKVLPSAVVILT